MNSEDCDSDDYDSDDDDPYVKSIISKQHGGAMVETGVVVNYPGLVDPASKFNKPLTLSTVLQEDDLAPLFHGTQWAGTRVWKAALIAIDYVLQNVIAPMQQDGQQQTLSFLELGCGLGVPGMVLHALHPTVFTNVVLTDQQALLEQLNHNLKENFGTEVNDDNAETRQIDSMYNIHARALSWTSFSEQEKHDQGHQNQDDEAIDNSTTDKATETTIQSLVEEMGPFDICLNCDCVYEPLYGRQAWIALADTLTTLAKINHSKCKHRNNNNKKDDETATSSCLTNRPLLLLTSVERRTADAVEDFLQRLESQLQEVITNNMVGGEEETCAKVIIKRVLVDDSDPHHVIEIYSAKIPAFHNSVELDGH